MLRLSDTQLALHALSTFLSTFEPAKLLPVKLYLGHISALLVPTLNSFTLLPQIN